MSESDKNNILPQLLSKSSKPEHPWARRIKDIFSYKYKHAHNSINNPIYPKKTKPADDRIKFTIIGDRFSEEYLYSVNLVRSLHKRRKTIFDAPEIQGVTTVEWPNVCNVLKNRYGGLAFCLSSPVAVLINDEFYGGEVELKDLIETEYDYYLRLNYYKESVAEFYKFIKSSGRPCAYMQIKINDELIGTLIFMLFADIVPNTCDNFLRLCKERRGGYSGTPIHRIVKEGWIQGGGFGLKSTDLDCENFIVPFDRRGVLGMANAGRHLDCSTQFFILLQPAKWMTHKYVAFGQLIEGNKTLERIEAEPTWYESPNSRITIYDSGIFNMDCHDIRINKGTKDYIYGHIDDLNAVKNLLYKIILERVFLTVHLRELGDGEQETEEVSGIRETKKFIQKKEELQNQEKNAPSLSCTTTVTQTSATTKRRSKSSMSATVDNIDFDVETYDPEFEEETDYKHESIPTSESPAPQQEEPFYIPLTDVTYPGEKDSQLNLRGFLTGDYSLEGDLPEPSKGASVERLRIPSYLFDEEEEDEESDELDTDEEKEVVKFLEYKRNRMTFAGDVIKDIAKGAGKRNIFAALRKSDIVTDDDMRRFRVATQDLRARELRDKKVSISVPTGLEHRTKIRRRQTGFVHPEDMLKLEMIRKLSMQAKHMFDETDDEDEEESDSGSKESREVVIAVPEEEEEEEPHDKIKRRQTGFVRKEDLAKIRLLLADDDDDEEEEEDEAEKHRQTQFQVKPATDPSTKAQRMQRRPTAFVRPGTFEKFQRHHDDDEADVAKALNEKEKFLKASVLGRLYDEVANDTNVLPTLKHYKPSSEQNKKFLLKPSTQAILEDDVKNERYNRSLLYQRPSFATALHLHHDSKLSTDNLKAIEKMERYDLKEWRAPHFARSRPMITVSEYKTQNKRYQDVVKRESRESVKSIHDLAQDFDRRRRRTTIRLPSDSSVYTMF